ncbi:MAG: hypothetical protein AABY26_00495 [Nanoarchaeota archaeon]
MTLPLPSENISELIRAIKKKKELSALPSEFVQKQLELFWKQQPKTLQVLQQNFNPKSQAYSFTLKSVRAQLRRKVGLFHAEEKKVLPLPAKITSESLQNLLEAHSSTRERLPFYFHLYSQLWKLTKKPKIILDLGCGINPLSLMFMGIEETQYYAYDINEKEVSLLNHFFSQWEKNHSLIQGNAAVLDFTDLNALRKLPAADVCFLFKVTDILDQGKGHKKTEDVLQAIPARFVVISFPTLTMSGRKMTAPRRNWMEWLCRRLGYEYKILEFENEIFYVVRKTLA